MTRLCGVWWCSNTIYMEEVITRNKYYGVITKRMNLNCPIVVTSESVAPNVNDLELNAVPYAFSKIFQIEM